MKAQDPRTTSTLEKSSSPANFSKPVMAGMAVLSLLYFADILFKASRKCFWFDELFAIYLCRLPNFHSTWAAVAHGADFNPPLFYLLTRGAQRLFGEGLIGSRVPAMLGVWIFCLCLYFFVAKHAGAIAGCIAALFPLFTLAQYYAYEARAHGIVLGCCGLTLICWQRIADGRKKYAWLGGFGLCLAAALLTHVYAVYLLFPFTLVEFYKIARRQRPDWGILIVMSVVFLSVTLSVYLPLFRAYQTVMPSTFAFVTHDMFQRYLVNVLGPAVFLFALLLLLSVWDGTGVGLDASRPAAIPQRDLVVAIGFAAIPFMGLLGSKLSHGPFFDRYFLTGIAGYAIFFGFAASRMKPGARSPKVLAACMVLLMAGDLLATIYLVANNKLIFVEPTSGMKLGTTPLAPMERYETLVRDDGIDTLVISGLEYMYFFRYGSPAIVSHLYYASSPNDVFFGAYQRLAVEAHLELKTTTFSPFLATHNRFRLYDSRPNTNLDVFKAIASRGYRLVAATPDDAGILYEYAK